MESVSEDAEVAPEIIDAKKHSKLRGELFWKLFHLKEFRRARSIESEYLDGVIKVAEKLAEFSAAVQKESKVKEMIEEVERLTALFYESEFKLERDLGYSDGEWSYCAKVPKNSKFPFKIVHQHISRSSKFNFYEGEANENGELTRDDLKYLGTVRLYEDFVDFELFEVCMEIRSSGVLYATVEHLESGDMHYQLLQKGAICSKSEVEDKIKALELNRTLSVANEEDMGKLPRRGKSFGEKRGEEIQKLIAEEFERYESDVEGLIKANQQKILEKLQSLKLEIQEERKVYQLREIKICQLKEEMRKLKIQKERDIAKEVAELVEKQGDLEKCEHEEMVENHAEGSAKKVEGNLKNNELKSQLEELEKVEIGELRKDLKRSELEKRLRDLEEAEMEQIKKDLGKSKEIIEKFRQELKETSA